MEPHEIKNLLPPPKKVVSKLGENLCYLYIRQGTDNQNIQGSHKTKLLKNQCPIKKWETELNRTFSKEAVQMAKKTHMEICSPSLAINANENHTKILPHSC
jgi:hypothetical protein